MSGIAGILCFNGAPVEPGLIEKLTGAMAHRGPHGIHRWAKGSVALGHCMLRTTPESLQETQPLASEDESLVLVMDGRLDTRDELRRELRARGIRLRTDTDSELVLGAYRIWGEECPRHLLGDFAFAIWDAKRAQLFCARDHFGVRPFYYVIGKNYLGFASDEEALLGLPGVSNEPNRLRLAYLLLLGHRGYDFDASWLEDILPLNAGGRLSVLNDGRLAVSTYWKLEPMEESRFASDAECEEAFNSVFEEAVRCRLRALNHPALMLSGGIDSASVAGVARQGLRDMLRLQLHTFSTVSDDPSQCSETRNIREITRGYEEQAHLLSVPSFRGPVSAHDLKDAAWTHAHPVGNSILLPTMMYLAAGRSGIRVMFDGLDGDLVTHAPNRGAIACLLHSGEWSAAWSEARQSGANHTYLQRRSPFTLLAKGAWDVYVPTRIKRLKRSIGRMMHGGSLEGSFINPDFAGRTAVVEHLGDYQANAGNEQGNQQEHIRALTQPGISCTMEGFDQAAARYGVEPRHPWSDKRLVEFCLRLPMRQKVRNGWTKYLLRKAMAPRLGSDICWHKEKNHLGWHLVRNLLDNNHDDVCNALQTSKDTLEEYAAPNMLQSLQEQYHDGPDHTGLEKIHLILSIALWLRRIQNTGKTASGEP